MKIAFCSDWHLNFADKSRKNKLANLIINSNCDLVLVAGDIAESDSLENELAYIIKRYEKPTYFVLGNHDYYRESFYFTKQKALNLSSRYEHLHYLPANGVVELNKDTCLIGYDSMYDCLNGKFFGGKYDFEIADFCHIGELKFLNRKDIYKYMVDMGALLADQIRKELPPILDKYKNVYLLTHVPPFKVAALYNDCPTEPEALPLFTNKQLGDALLEVMSEYPNNKLNVLAGHTHNGCQTKIDNINVNIAKGRYCYPDIHMILDLL